MVGTPYPSLGNKVAITAWTSPSGGNGEGHAAICPTFNEKAFSAFRDAYRGKGPERFPVDIAHAGRVDVECRGRESNPHAPRWGQLILSQPRIANFATPATAG